jgi:hypothetical protein
MAYQQKDNQETKDINITANAKAVITRIPCT